MTTTTAPQHDELKTLSRLKVSPRIAWPTVILMVSETDEKGVLSCPTIR